MAIHSTSLMGMMHEKMTWASQRQTVLAQNIANANTPGYKARDLKALDFKKTLGLETNRPALSRTHSGHISAPGDDRPYGMASKVGSYEVSPDGNSVVHEEQLMKLQSTSADHKVASHLYKKYMGMYRIALGK